MYGKNWTKEEVELLVTDYFIMLRKELRGEQYVKAHHRKNLEQVLSGRTKKSIENKHQNVSAILQELGKIYIFGYKPFGNYQQMMVDIVIDHLLKEEGLENDFETFVNHTIIEPSKIPVFSKWLEAPPDCSSNRMELQARELAVRKVNWVEKEQSNRSTGRLGEKLVLSYEKWLLEQSGRHDLAEKVEWTSEKHGDGAGFDILSFNAESGDEKFIEVKTTRLAKNTPVYFTRNELNFSITRKSQYCLSRVFKLYNTPKIFEIKGSLDETFKKKEALLWKGFF